MADTLQTTGTTTWKLDPTHSLVEFSAKHMMITTVKGSFGEVTGTIYVDHGNPDRSRAEVEIGTGSIDTRVSQRDEHLRSADFLDVENHPSIIFRSTRIEGAHAEAGDRFQLFGELTIRGVTREIELDAAFEGSGTDPWGGERASFSAETKLDRREFGLTWNQTLEKGGILVSNELKVNIEVQAVRAS